MVAVSSPRPAVPLEVLGQRARLVTLAAERTLPVLPALAPLLPDGVLARGSSLDVAGPGATSLAVGLVAAASAAGAWTVVVGADDLGLVAAAEAGLALERTVLVATPPPERWATVVAALAESVEVLLVRATGRVRAGEARRLRGHLRRRGGVLVRLPGPGSWPEPADVSLRTSSPEWRGAVGVDRLDGAGRLLRRRVAVEARGRGRASRPRRLELWLPGPDGAPAPVHDARHRADPPGDIAPPGPRTGPDRWAAAG